MRHLIFIFLILLALGGYSQTNNDGLLLYYPFDGNVEDLSGNNFHGTAVGVTSVADHLGNPSSAYHFDGQASYIDFPDDMTLKPQLPISFTYWVNFDDTSNPLAGQVVTTDYSHNVIGGAFMSLSSTGAIGLSFGDGGDITSTSRRSKSSSTILESGRWYYIAGVIRSATDMDIYIDCENDGGTYSGTGGDLEYTSAQGTIGRNDRDAGESAYAYFSGSLDDFKYYDRALLAEEITGCPQSVSVDEDIKSIETECNLFVYPNPSQDYLYIQSKSIYDQIQVIGLDGQIISESCFSKRIQIDYLPVGLYILKGRSITDGAFHSVTFVKQ